MRAFVITRIKNLPNKPASLAGLTIMSSAAAEDPVEPFMIVSMDVEVTPLGMPDESRTQMVPFTCWVHDRGASMVRIDDAAVWLKNNMPTDMGFKVGNMSVYNIRWASTGGDVYDDHFKSNTRPVRFEMMTRR